MMYACFGATMDISPISFVILVMATYRMGNLLSWEAGPYGVFDKIRYWLGVRYDEHNKPYGSTEPGKMVLCIYCNSAWIAFVLVALYYVLGDVVVMVCAPFAVSGLAIAINEYVGSK